jgi:hypothetical protein
LDPWHICIAFKNQLNLFERALKSRDDNRAKGSLPFLRGHTMKPIESSYFFYEAPFCPSTETRTRICQIQLARTPGNTYLPFEVDTLVGLSRKITRSIPLYSKDRMHLKQLVHKHFNFHCNQRSFWKQRSSDGEITIAFSIQENN